MDILGQSTINDEEQKLIEKFILLNEDDFTKNQLNELS